MICPICDKEITEDKFSFPIEFPYANILVCREHLSIGYREFSKQYGELLAKMLINGKIIQKNQIKRV